VALKIVRDILIGSAAVIDLVGNKVSPLSALQGESYPFVVLTVVSVDPINALSGFAGLNRSHVQIEAWAFEYRQASDIAAACRSALESAGHLCIAEVTEIFDFQTDASVFRAGFVHEIWN
jgi:hypothetical protein